MLTDEYRYKILKLVEANPEISQRELASQLGVSLGKANFCLKALVNVGLLKVSNFRNSNNKLAYMYLLTPSAIEQRATITKQFLKLKMDEYEHLCLVIKELQQDVSEIKKLDGSI